MPRAARRSVAKRRRGTKAGVVLPLASRYGLNWRLAGAIPVLRLICAARTMVNPAVVEGTPAPAGRIARNYLELIDCIALRMTDLNVQHLVLDERCGLAAGYTGKLLGPNPSRNYGPMSFDLHLQALGLRLVVEPDPDRPPVLTDTRLFRARDADAVLSQRLATREGRELLAAARSESAKKGWTTRRQHARRAAEAEWRQPQDRPVLVDATSCTSAAA
jgi:hypothetical protein